ncbi:hypothetical protein IC611_18640 [Proteus mirabilis]
MDMTVTNAGTIRLALAFKKLQREKLLLSNPLNIIDVIKKPDMTKIHQHQQNHQVPTLD